VSVVPEQLDGDARLGAGTHRHTSHRRRRPTAAATDTDADADYDDDYGDDYGGDYGGDYDYGGYDDENPAPQWDDVY